MCDCEHCTCPVSSWIVCTRCRGGHWKAFCDLGSNGGLRKELSENQLNLHLSLFLVLNGQKHSVLG